MVHCTNKKYAIKPKACRFQICAFHRDWTNDVDASLYKRFQFSIFRKTREFSGIGFHLSLTLYKHYVYIWDPFLTVFSCGNNDFHVRESQGN